jgi:hypothetical protein
MQQQRKLLIEAIRGSDPELKRKGLKILANMRQQIEQ